MTVWWVLKVMAGLGLMVSVIGMVHGFWAADPRLFAIPRELSVSLVLVGAGISLWHYGILKREAKSLAKPERLVTRGGLFGMIRHPMYTGDALVMLAFAVWRGDWIAFLMLALGWFSLVMQARAEDRAMNHAFGEVHGTWASKTGLLVPKAGRSSSKEVSSEIEDP